MLTDGRTDGQNIMFFLYYIDKILVHFPSLRSGIIKKCVKLQFLTFITPVLEYMTNDLFSLVTMKTACMPKYLARKLRK